MQTVEPIKSADRFENPECQQLLADLRELSERADLLKTRLDRGGVVGTLWGVCTGLREALHCAERELQREQEDNQ